MVTNSVAEKPEEAVTKLLQVFNHPEKTEPDKASTRRIARNARLQLVLPENSVERLEALKEVTEATSYAEVIRRALRIYEGLLAETAADGKIFVRRSDGSEEIVPLHRAL